MRAGRSGALSLIGFAVAALGGLLLNVVVGRSLGAAGAGVFFTAVALTVLASTMLIFGADTGLLRSLNSAEATGRFDDLRTTMRAGLLPLLVAGAVCALALLVLSGPIAGGLLQDHPGGAQVARLLALAVPGTALGLVLLSGAARGLGTTVPFVTVWQVGLPTTRLAAVAVAGATGGGLAVIFAAWSLPLVPVVALAALIVHRRLRGLATREAAPTPGLAGGFWRFAAPRGVDALFAAAVTWIDVVLVAVLRSPAEAGVYAAASRFITSGALALQASRMAIAPRLAQAFATGALHSAERLYADATVVVVLLSWPVFLVLAIFPEPFLELFGPEFPAAATALTILAVAQLYVSAAGNVSTVLLMAGRSRLTARNSGTALVVLVVLDLLLVPRFGIEGAAVGWAVALVTESTLGLFAVRARVGLRGHSSPTLLAAALALLVYGVGGLLLRAVAHGGVAAFGGGLLGLTVVYALAVLLLAGRLRGRPGRRAGALPADQAVIRGSGRDVPDDPVDLDLGARGR